MGEDLCPSPATLGSPDRNAVPPSRSAHVGARFKFSLAPLGARTHRWARPGGSAMFRYLSPPADAVLSAGFLKSASSTAGLTAISSVTEDWRSSPFAVVSDL